MESSAIDKRYTRVLTLKDVTLLGLSMTIGSGIFVLIDVVAHHSHNLTWLSFLLAGVVSMLTALSYGELASIFRNNMGEADYIRAVTNDTVANTMGFFILISDIFILSTISLGLGNYLSHVVNISPVILSVLAIVSLNYLNYRGIRLSVNVSNGALYLKLSIILLIIISSFIKHTPKEPIFKLGQTNTYQLSVGAIIALFAYLGFNNMTNFTEETINPEVNIGKAIITTVASVTVIYTLIAIAAIYVMTSKELSKTTTPLADIIGRLFGSYGFTLFIILAIISLIDTLLVSSVSESRYMHSFLAQINPEFGQDDMDQHTKTPYISIMLLVALTVLVIVFIQKIGLTALYGDLLILSIFVIVNIITIILRFKQPDKERKFKVPFNIGSIPIPSVLGALFGLYGIYRYIGGTPTK